MNKSKMRKVTFGGANSLDNFIARKDDAVDWLMWSKDAAAIMEDYWKTIDTIVMGRRTYEISEKMGGGPPHPGINVYVISRTLKKVKSKDVQLISEDAADFVRKLKKEKGKDICIMGGGILARSLFEADLIDEIGFNVHPVLLGSGIPLFHEMKKQINLKLIECRQLKHDCVYLLYNVRHKEAARKGATKGTKADAKRHKKEESICRVVCA
jgi:dihydrofolate reductase